MLRQIRKNSKVNWIIRTGLREFGDVTVRLTNAVRKRWPVSGAVSVEFDDLRLLLSSKCDDGLVDALFYRLPLHEASDLKLFLGLAKGCRVIFDVGAHTGLYSLLSALRNPSCEIYAFEPYSYNRERLEENCALNNLTQIRVVPKAVGEREARIEFTVPKQARIIDTASANNEFARLFYAENVEWTNIQVDQISLDQFARENLEGKKVDLIKIDVEGYEINVFDGMQEILERHAPNILFETFLDPERKQFFDAVIDRYGYTPYMILEEGIIRLDEGLQSNKSGLNYFLSQRRSYDAFTPFDQIQFLSH